ncbi:hypothetical protein [Nostoc sp. ChiQUE01b]|uniref:hypothetical protein n=1 Tax=Nostoc sp. ChiQUE01b TaxID=3075376 RepID=UPI002AD4928D|nr:hypothetical protein [Nostoc sp. ChiQUE01b]MDZ8264057.1 hypothetical protein [Nostoc sp. ChiQUE01b]
MTDYCLEIPPRIIFGLEGGYELESLYLPLRVPKNMQQQLVHRQNFEFPQQQSQLCYYTTRLCTSFKRKSQYVSPSEESEFILNSVQLADE